MGKDPDVAARRRQGRRPQIPPPTDSGAKPTVMVSSFSPPFESRDLYLFWRVGNSGTRLRIATRFELNLQIRPYQDDLLPESS
jgi:hypothetical protein